MSVDNNIPNGWMETTLEEVAIINPRESLKKGELATNIPMAFIDSFSKKIQTTDKKEYKGGTKFRNGDTLLARITPCLENGKTAFVDVLDKNEVGFGSTEYIVLREKENYSNKHFLFYLSISPKFREVAIKLMTGTSGRQRVQTNSLVERKFYLPPLNEQKAIAKILTSFDDKIELLQAQNKTLETTAQTIFKEWFGKYQIDDELPEGWRVYQMNELVDTVNGYSYKGKELVEESNEALVTLKSFDRNGGFQTRGFKPFKGNPKPTQEVQIGDLVVAHTDLTQDAEVLGNPAFIFDNGGFEKMYITMDLVKVLPKHKDVSSSFLYYLMKDRAFKGHCVGYSNGTTVLHLSKKAIPEYQLNLPLDFSLIKQFSEIADSTTSKISLNKEEIKYLKKTRDTLLPKLMKGSLRVDEFKEIGL